jgi:hypothetical protein
VVKVAVQLQVMGPVPKVRALYGQHLQAHVWALLLLLQLLTWHPQLLHLHHLACSLKLVLQQNKS